jgi:hypothetical protein
MSDRTYKRSWRNLLINKRYQLRFTLFMVGLSAVLMAGLGWWVMRTADEATDVAVNAVPPCPKPTEVVTAPTAPPPTPMTPDDSGETHHHVVVEVSDAMPPEYPAQFTAQWICTIEHSAQVEDLRAGRNRIFYVLLATGLFLVLALAFYGIKTTHKVAGPLYKVTLYFQKMRDGRYDKVWPLRKGDQLVAFYDHFRQAHAGVVKMEETDVERLRAILEAADAHNLKGKSPEIDAALDELREALARKEKSLA